MEKRTSVEKELEELHKFKREIEKRSRKELEESVKNIFPDLEIKETDGDAYLKGILYSYEQVKEMEKRSKKNTKAKKIPSETGEPPKQREVWEEILD